MDPEHSTWIPSIRHGSRDIRYHRNIATGTAKTSKREKGGRNPQKIRGRPKAENEKKKKISLTGRLPL
jgi:hypothetical protein